VAGTPSLPPEPGARPANGALAAKRNDPRGANAWRWLRLSLGPGLLVFILSTLDLRALGEAFAGADPTLLVLAYLLPLPPIALRTWRWRSLLGPYAQPWRFSELLALYAQSIAAGVLTPGRVGELARGVLVSRRGAPLGAAVLSAVIDRMADLSFLAILAGAALPLVVLTHSRGVVWIWVLAGGTLLAMALLWVVAASPRGEAVRRRLLRAVEGSPASSSESTSSSPESASDPAAGLVGGVGRGVAARAALLTVLSWAVTYGANYCFGLSLGLPLSYFEMAGISAVCSLVASLPISIAGAGTRDAALIAILAGYGIGSAEAVALSTLMLSNVLFAGAVCSLAFVVGPLAGAERDR
jgi:uncharacterized membrane protein YbhN (UPF0104 family)